MEQKRQSPRNWLVIFLAVLVGLWLLPQVLGVASNALWHTNAEVAMDNFALFSRINTSLLILQLLIPLVALVVVVSMLRKWAVLWPVPVFYAVNRMSTFIFLFLITEQTSRALALLSAINMMFNVTAAALTFFLVRRHNQKTQTQPEPTDHTVEER
ncbi:MAG: hypothetical protein FWB76_02405 [Oscillospiraceae bacterium]|nr:hypothetical protein [Oscillospiraceae bacterium]